MLLLLMTGNEVTCIVINTQRGARCWREKNERKKKGENGEQQRKLKIDCGVTRVRGDLPEIVGIQFAFESVC